MSLRFLISLVFSFVCLAAPSMASAQVQTFTATHTYLLGDHDSKDDARQRGLLETKRKILEQAGVYIESASEVKNFDLTKDKITSFAAAVMKVEDTLEEVGFQQGHMTLTLTITAQVDLAEVRKQLAARQLDASVRNDMTAQQERLKRLEAQLEAMQKQQRVGQAPGRAPAFPPIDISAEDLQSLHTQAAQGNAEAQNALGFLYLEGQGVPEDYTKARQWFEKAAAQGSAEAQYHLGGLYFFGMGVPVDITTARGWYAKSAAQGNAVAQVQFGALYDFGIGVPQNDMRAYMWYSLAAERSKEAGDTYAADRRDNVFSRMTPPQIEEAQRLSRQCQARQFKGC